MLELRRLHEVDLDAVLAQDERAFALHYGPEVRPLAESDVLAMTSAWAALDGGDVVGFAGSRRHELTVSPGHTVPVHGVTWVSVAASHRRRGIAARLLANVHDDARADGAAAAVLTASEGAIYGRFGYGPATMFRQVQIDRRAVRFRRAGVAPGRVCYLTASEADRRGAELYGRYRCALAGAISRPVALAAVVRHRLADAYWVGYDNPDGGLDGLAAYTIVPGWNGGQPANELTIQDLVCVGPHARRALLEVVLSTDLVGDVTTKQLPLDDPLPWELEDRRAVRVRDEFDMMWLAPFDVARLLGARATHASSERIVLEVVGGSRWALHAEGGRLVVGDASHAAEADLVLGPSELGSLALGGVTPTQLARAGRIEVRSGDALRRAERLWHADTLPFCNTMF